ncbi:hypothetical protein FKM82_000977 [Ascaphus truei]
MANLAAQNHQGRESGDHAVAALCPLAVKSLKGKIKQESGPPAVAITIARLADLGAIRNRRVKANKSREVAQCVDGPMPETLVLTAAQIQYENGLEAEIGGVGGTSVAEYCPLESEIQCAIGTRHEMGRRLEVGGVTAATGGKPSDPPRQMQQTQQLQGK